MDLFAKKLNIFVLFLRFADFSLFSCDTLSMLLCFSLYAR